MGRPVVVVNLGQGLVGRSGISHVLLPEGTAVVEVGIAGVEEEGVGAVAAESGGEQAAEVEVADVNLADIVCAEVVLAGIVLVGVLIAEMEVG